MSDVITTHELSKRYRKHLALDKLSFRVPEGSVYALLGANGAGKTTALKLLMNLHPPTSGQAKVLGIDASQLQGRHFENIGDQSDHGLEWPRLMLPRTRQHLLDARGEPFITPFQLVELGGPLADTTQPTALQ